MGQVLPQGDAFVTARVYRELISRVAQQIFSETFPRSLMAGATLATQQIFATALPLRQGDVLANLSIAVTTAGAGTVPATFKLALCDRNGKVLGQTANVNASALLTATGVATFPFAAEVRISQDDLYYACVLQNGVFGTTPIQVGRILAVSASCYGPVGNGMAVVLTQTGQTDFAATGSSQTLIAGGAAVWIAAS